MMKRTVTKGHEWIRKTAAIALALALLIGSGFCGMPDKAYAEEAVPEEASDAGPILRNPPPIWGLDFETYTQDSYPLQVVNGPLNLFVMTKGTAVAELKLKNTSNETVTAAAWAGATYIVLSDDPDDYDAFTPYTINDEDALKTHEVTGATPTTRESERGWYEGYDIAPGATATFWISVDTRENSYSDPVLTAGTYTDYIRIGAMEHYYDFIYEDGWTTVYKRNEITDIYTEKIPISLTVYDPEVTASVGSFNAQNYTITQKDLVDFGTIDLSQMDGTWESGQKTLSFGIKNTSTVTDTHIGAVPDLTYRTDVLTTGGLGDQTYGTIAGFSQTTSQSGMNYIIGPGAIGEIGVQLNHFYLVEGTYTGELRLSTVPAKVTVNGGAVTDDPVRGIVTIPIKVKLTGTNPNLPPAVTGLTATPGNSMVELNWDPLGEEYSVDYQVYRREGVETVTDWRNLDYSLYTNVGKTHSREGTRYVDGSAENGKTYSYFVIAAHDYYAYENGPYTGYPSNTASASPDASHAIKLMAPELRGYEESGYVELSWYLSDEDPFITHPSGEGAVDHFNIYRNGKLYRRVDRNAVTEDFYYAWEDGSFSWKLNVESEPYAMYNWQISAVAVDGTEGYLSGVVECMAYPVMPEIVGYQAIWTEDGEWSDDYGEWVPKDGGDVLKISYDFSGYPMPRLLDIKRDGVEVAHHVDFEDGWEDHDTQPGRTYTYTAVGITYYADETKPYSFTITTPPRGSHEKHYDTSQYTEFFIDNGTTPTLQFYRLEDCRTVIYRNDTAMASYETGDEVFTVFRDTPTADGTYVYRVDRTDVETGTVIKSRDYIFVRDTTPTLPEDLPKKPGTPTLTGFLSDYAMVLNWTPSTEGGEPRGFYIYSTMDGEYRTDNWNDFGECDGEAGTDYPKLTRDRLVRKDASSRTYTDIHASWQNTDHAAVNSWWIVAYNEYGLSEPSEPITFTGEWNEQYETYGPPSNCTDELPGTPEITDVSMDFEETWYSADDVYDPTQHDLYAKAVLSWTPSRTGGQADYFKYNAVTEGHSTTDALVFAGKGDKDDLLVYMPDDVGKTYSIDLRAVNGAGESDMTHTTFRITSAPKMSLRDISENEVEIKWAAPEEEGFAAASYRLERKSRFTAWETAVETPDARVVQSGSVFTFTDSGLIKGTEYTYRVTAVGTDGVERTSMAQSITPKGFGAALDPPTDLAVQIVDGCVYLTWREPENGAVKHYDIQIKCQPGQEEYWDDPDGWMDPQYWHTGADSSAELDSGYYRAGEETTLRIRASNDAGESGWSNAVTFTITEAQQEAVETAKPAPVVVSLEEGDSKLTLRWNRVPAGTYEDKYGDPIEYGEATYYRIDKGRMSADPVDLTSYKIFADRAGNPSGAYEFVDTNVINGEFYQYSVLAFNSEGAYIYSEDVMMVYGIPNGKTAADYAAEAFEALVASLPDPSEVTLDDKDAIEEALGIYENMTDKEKNAVDDETKEKLDALVDALKELEVREEYGDRIDDVQALIDALPDADDVTLADAQQIAEALEAYNALPDEAKDYVDTEKLDAVLQAIIDLQKEQQDKAAASEVEAMIYALPDPADVTAADADAINAAREAYEALTDDQKAYVSEEALELLEEIEAALEEIMPVNVSDLTILPVDDQYWTGGEIRPDLTVKREKNGETITLTAGTDYTLSYASNIEIGQAAITLTGQGRYTGTRTVNFNIVPADLRGWEGVDAASVTGITDRMYDGNAQTQDPVVEFRGITLTPGTDYNVSYRDNINVGSATVIITGTGHYTGSVETTFRIESNIDRIAGSNRYKTAFDAADRLKEVLGVSAFPNVVVASGSDFPDALAGAYLAKVKDAPILLTNAAMAPTVAEYIKMNMAADGVVYILGGTGAVPAVMETELKKLGFTDANIDRLAGPNRYMTNLEILRAAGVAGEDILVCSGKGYADSLSASAVGKPILLVPDSITPAQADFLAEFRNSLSGNVYAIGGTGAVSDKAFDQVVEALSDSEAPSAAEIERVYGSNRYTTSTAVAAKFFPDGCERVVLAYAMNYPDGLAGGPLAYALDAPLLLVTNSSYAPAKDFAAAAGAARCTVLGGPTLISDEVAMSIVTK